MSKRIIKVVIDRIGRVKYEWHEIDPSDEVYCHQKLTKVQRVREFPSRHAITAARDPS